MLKARVEIELDSKQFSIADRVLLTESEICQQEIKALNGMKALSYFVVVMLIASVF